jgi:hypothetical protein
MGVLCEPRAPCRAAVRAGDRPRVFGTSRPPGELGEKNTVHDSAIDRIFRLGRLLTLALLAAAVVGCPSMPDGDPDPGRPVDTDEDGVADDDDICDDTPAGAVVDDDGCASSQRDTDGDGVSDAVDACADTPEGDEVDGVGCTIPPVVLDDDGDGIGNGGDNCPNTPPGSTVDQRGCAASQRDTDGDGVSDNIDQCANTTPGATVDAFGCAEGQTGVPDADDDGVRDDADDCPGTPAGAIVDDTGCAESQVDADGDGVTDDVDECPNTQGSNVDASGCASNQRDSDSDGVNDDADRCPGTPAGTTVNSQGCPTTGGGGTPVCGNGVVEAGEQCEPPGSRCCTASCQNVSGGEFTSDNCGDATTLCDDEGSFAFDNTAATADGPPHTGCVFFGEDQIDHDVWSCWTAPCSGTVFISTCDGNTAVDTKIAVYEGCDCPVTDARLLSCNDDVCDTQSVVTFEAVAGQNYLLRLGTFPDEAGGAGSVQITCGLDACEQGEGDCFAAHASPGCDSEDCCERVCAIDPFCCDTEWDAVCADEADGFCGAGFGACGAGAGACTDPENGTPGCEDVDCCNAVCRADPFCCGVGGEEGIWDELCAEAEAAICRSTCGPRRGDCFAKVCSGGTGAGNACETDDDCAGGGTCIGNGTAGCELEDCCANVCPRDPYCCQVDWDPACADMARSLCTAP